ncbi:MAG: FAD-binding protein [Chloroflexota bacterium]|nr:FAD-binding protein [Chloroflexota bacterium]
MLENRRNWAGNYTYSAARLHTPETIEQLQELVSRSSKLRALGSRHSFNGIADTTADQISMAHFDRVLSLDRERNTVTIEAGIKYGQLGQYLHGEGYALHNMASLPHISVAGACATATHGSGNGNGNLATAVAAIELVTANGDLVVLSREQDGEAFQGAVVGLGGLGLVTKMTLDILPTFAVQQEVYENLPVTQLDVHFEDIVSSAYSVSLFTDWSQGRVNQIWLKRHLTDNSALQLKPTFFEATLATQQRHPIDSLSGEPCTPQMGEPGPWNERLPHFRMDQTPSNGEELQTEYFVPRQHAVAALRAITELHEQIAPFLMISEIRTIAADTLWMSPCYQQDSVALHFTWKLNWPKVQKLLPLIEAQLAPFNARPHWGKLFTMPPAQLQSLYSKLPDFQQLLCFYDPQGKFRNAFLDTYIFGST